VATARDILQNPQLQARGYFRQVTDPRLATTVTYPGPFVQASAVPMSLRRLPPKIGEHNAEIYRDELGLTREELAQLHEAGVI
jgi:formyl-CoA transferase